jgi:hypothetical protein
MLYGYLCIQELVNKTIMTKILGLISFILFLFFITILWIIEKEFIDNKIILIIADILGVIIVTLLMVIILAFHQEISQF